MAFVNVQLEADGPITQLDESKLIRSTGHFEDENECTSWVEYRLASDCDGRVVHRSVDMVLKKAAVFADGFAANLK